MVKSSTEARRAIPGGVFSGLVAGVALTTMIVIMSAARGKDVWYGIKGTAAPLIGESAMLPGFDLAAVWLGLVSHLMISIGWAIGFALVAYGLRRSATIAAGAAWGVVVWLGMYYVVLPMVGLASMRNDAPASRAIMFHVFFGLAVAGGLLLYRRLTGHSQPEAEAAGEIGDHVRKWPDAARLAR
jgi:hypothetical protein